MSHVVPRAFSVIDISAWDAGEIEEMGARDKLWVDSNPGTVMPSHLWKEARSHGRLPDYGADSCAERIAAEIACLLGVLAVPAELAVRHSQRGVITERIEGELRHGNELLSALMPDYEKDRRGPVPGYDLESIQSVLVEYRGWSKGMSAFDCFTGLLFFDALIGNTDRHHENWAVVQDTGTLAPSSIMGRRSASTPRQFRWRTHPGMRHGPGPGISAVIAAHRMWRRKRSHW